jgi:hypothetical protein
MATQYSNKPIITDGLVYALDFGNQKSYVSGSATANSLKYETNLTFVTGSTSIPNLQNGVLFFTGSQWVERTGSFNVFNPNGAFTLSIVVNSRTAGTLVSQTSSLGNLTSNVSPTSSAFGFINPNYNRGIQGLSSTQLNHLTYRYSSGSLDIFYNGTLVTASQAIISLPTSSVVDEFYINGNNGLLNNFSGSLAAISVYNRALTINEVQSNYTIARTRYGLTQEQNYTLDENAYLFLQSAGITDPIITGSIDTFVRGLKANNLWDKMIAIYPFVGTGSAGTNLTGSHRWNLKEPSLVTYPLSFTGSWIGSTSGSAPSGSNTNISVNGITPSQYYPFFNTQSAHISILSYDTPVSSSYLMGTEGTINTSSFSIYYNSGSESGSITGSINNEPLYGIQSSGPLGLVTVSRTGSNSLTIARNGAATSFSVPASGALSTGIYLGAINNNGLALGNSPLNISFASVGTGLTDSEVRTYNSLVNNFKVGIQYPQLVTNGLVMLLDPGNRVSYPGSGNTWYDFSGNNNTGSITGTPIYNLDSGSFMFDTSYYVTVPRSVQDDFSLSCWFRTTQNAGSGTGNWFNGRGLIDCETGGFVGDFGLAVGAGQVLFGTGNPPNPDVTTRSGTLYNDNIWHLATGVREKSTGKLSLYVDGILKGTAVAGTTSLTASPILTIGCIKNISNFFSGSIGLIQIYNKALSPSEITQNYNATRGRFGI